MSTKNKHRSAIFLVCIYALLVFQESILTQVLCSQKNGPAKLELAVLGYSCSCPTDHDTDHDTNHDTNHDTDYDTDREREKCEICSEPPCEDQPIFTSWLERINTPRYSKFTLSKSFDISTPPISIPECFSRLQDLPLLIPLTKFLPNISPPNNTIMRC